MGTRLKTYYSSLGTLLFLSAFHFAIAQDKEGAFEPAEKKEQTDQEAYQPPDDGQKYHKVLLVPYRPVMHLSDADVDIVQYSGMDLKKVHARFRAELDATIAHELKKVYKIKDLMMEDFEDETGDLDKIYQSIGYKMADVKPTYLNEEAQEENRKSLLEKVSFRKKSSGNNDEGQPEDVDYADTYLKTEGKDKQYMETVLHNKELLPYLTNKYEADLFVFINQLEIRTNYASCLDLANKVYEREIKVHFSVFDKEGNLLMGDLAVTVFPSNSNDVGEITANSYPLISEYVAKSIPQPHDTEQEKKEDHDKMIMKFQKKIQRKQAKQY